MNVLKPNKKYAVQVLCSRGKSQHEIYRLTGVDRKTIRKYQRKFECQTSSEAADSKSPSKEKVATGPNGSESQIPPPRPPGFETPKPSRKTKSACAVHEDWIKDQVALGRNAVAIYQDLVDLFGFENCYNSVKRFVKKLKKTEPHRYDRLEFFMGEEAQVDYGLGAPTKNEKGKRKRPRLFVMTLKYSGRSFRKTVWKSSKEIFSRLHEEAFHYFGGCPRYISLDNLKEGVITPDIYDPILNEVYQSMLEHYGVIADPARVGDPNRKGTVENAIQHTQSTALKGREFEYIEEQNDWLFHWEEKWAATRIHGRTKRQVEAMFQEEKPHLLLLPATRFQYFTPGVRTVSDEGTIQVDNSFYAANPAQVGCEVMIRLYEKELVILDPSTQQIIRRHTRCMRKGSLSIEPQDLIFNPSRETERLFLKASAIGVNTRTLCQKWFEDEGRVGHRKMYGLTNLIKTIPAEVVEEATKSAIRNGLSSLRSIRNHINFLMQKRKQKRKFSPAQELIQDHQLISKPSVYGEFFERHASTSQKGRGFSSAFQKERLNAKKAGKTNNDKSLYPETLHPNWTRLIAFFDLKSEPKKQNRDDEIWLHSPFAPGQGTCLQISTSQNRWKDFSTGKTGEFLSLCQMLIKAKAEHKPTMEETLKYIYKHNLCDVVD